MNALSTLELFELYRDTLSRCTSATLAHSDAELECELFEEFTIDARAYLHDDALLRLHAAGLIDQELVDLSRRIRAHWLASEEHPWTMAQIRNEPSWRALFSMCDEALERIKTSGSPDPT